MKHINWLDSKFYFLVIAVMVFLAAGCCTSKNGASCGMSKEGCERPAKICHVVNSAETGLDNNGNSNVTLNDMRGEQ